MKILNKFPIIDLILLACIHLASLSIFRKTYSLAEKFNEHLPLFFIISTLFSSLLLFKSKKITNTLHKELPIRAMLICALTLNLMDTLTGVHFWAESRSFGLALSCLVISCLAFKYSVFIFSNLIGVLTLLVSERAIIHASSMADRSIMIEIVGIMTITYIFLAILNYLGANHRKLKMISSYIYLSLLIAYLYGPGISKIMFDSWFSDNNTFQLVYNSLALPWPIVPYEFIAKFRSFFEFARPVLNLLVITLEVMPFIGILIPSLLIPGIIGFILLHLTIFAGSGIFFWKWIIVELAAIFIIKHLINTKSFELPFRLYILTVAVFFRTFTWSGADMHWYDGRITSDYIFSIGSSFEKSKVIPYYLFKPLEIHFSQKEFRSFDPDKTLITTYGTLRNHEAYMAQFKIENLDQYNQWLHKYGAVVYDEKSSRLFFNSLKKLICNVSLSNPFERLNFRIPHA